jgi:hypothetical protein
MTSDKPKVDLTDEVEALLDTLEQHFPNDRNKITATLMISLVTNLTMRGDANITAEVPKSQRPRILFLDLETYLETSLNNLFALQQETTA